MMHFSRYTKILIAISLLGCVNIILMFARTRSSNKNPPPAAYRPIPRMYLSSRACVFPRLRVNHSAVIKFLRDKPPITCPGEDLVEVKGSAAYITETTRQNLGDLECLVSDVLRTNDDANTLSVPQRVSNRYELHASDFIRINCSSSGGDEWENVMAGIRIDEEVVKRSGWDNVPPDALEYNVLLFGIHAMSKMMFERKLPRTLRFLREKLEAIEMKRYNIVGDGPQSALFPILTGSRESEFPLEIRKRFAENSQYLDSLPFIWKSFESNGFVTGFAEDSPETGVFSSRLKGFEFPPTDHYLRPFYLEAAKISGRNSKHCLGSIPKHKVMLNYILNFFRVYRDMPKFMVGFMKELTENSLNDIGAADGDILDWLTTLESEGHLQNTVFIVFSDQGSRHPGIRASQQGKFEERQPMLSFVLPLELRKGVSTHALNLKSNAVELTTPFDLYETLRDILHFEGTIDANEDDEATSLFKRLPEGRHCDIVNIEDHWCSCLDWDQIPWFYNDPRVTNAANAIIHRINAITEKHRRYCATLSLENIHSAVEFVPNPSVLRFRKTVDEAGVVIDMAANTTVVAPETLLEVTVSAVPGHAIFEVMLTYSVSDRIYHFEDAAISRINWFSPREPCLEHTGLQMHAYCVCSNANRRIRS